ncbi:hypothetical protein BDB00DRAFT_787743 [Zychaea mexicana]|uniref:uncharacterized protein n=1 Tax=Zychaea mexicana TaxID=64656 RepID=UPI0022FF01D7|nr:uncharacterized protein BDB00DRAFT_787743 [Zychaea mexicana]KAI9493636.1 hypothetical protein BDB00DRAFT_787743 [Zychaea mexicana]
MATVTPNNPPFSAYRGADKGSFAWDSTVRRWPIILDNAIADLEKEVQQTTDDKARQEGKTILDAIADLKNEIAADRPLRLINDKEDDTDDWNRHLASYFAGATWFGGTWLFNECYMYRRLHENFSNSTCWKQYDPFNVQKLATFKGSHGSVFDLAHKMPTLIQPMTVEQLEIVYDELIQVCLWGNATDLSLLTNMTEEDIKRLQAIEKDKLAEQKKRILVDDIEKLWEKIKSLQGSRVDFILDNSGFEVYVDLILADWLLQSGKASKVVLNCKAIPWFVSDVMPKDVPILFDCCLDRTFFPDHENRSEDDFIALETMVKRWKSYVDDGKLIVREHKFWCSGLPYWYLKSEAPELFNDLRQSDLVIFKGDLNFRKLLFDCDWPVTTPFKTAIGKEMGTEFTNIVSLRTNKADTIAGLPEGLKEELEKTVTPLEWRCSGKYAVVEYNGCP